MYIVNCNDEMFPQTTFCKIKYLETWLLGIVNKERQYDRNDISGDPAYSYLPKLKKKQGVKGAKGFWGRADRLKSV